MKAIYTNEAKNVVAYQYDNGICKIFHGVDATVTTMPDRYSAIQFANFQADAFTFAEAKAAGLNDDTAELVVKGKITIAEALGDADADAEVFFMEDAYLNVCEDDPEDDGFDPDFCGGEDDNTPPLEVLMAGGWASWEYQNEKNAWLDSRF